MRLRLWTAAMLAAGLALPLIAHADGDACPRPGPGAVATPAKDLHSHNGHLAVTLDYLTDFDAHHRARYCFVTPDGFQEPTLHVKPGDTLDITLRNRFPPPNGGAIMDMSVDGQVCGAATMNASSVNLHFHGTNTQPVCHQDEVIHTLVNSGQTFQYHVEIPANEPPGLYVYHPHVHPLTERTVLGGADGLIVVDGIQNLAPEVAGLPVREMSVRDAVVPGKIKPGGKVPSKDLSLNDVPIDYPANTPAVLKTPPGRKEFWRVANAAADTILDLRLDYDGAPQTLEIVALDGVATNSQDGARMGRPIYAKHILLGPTNRAEFIVTTPDASVKSAVLATAKVDTGPAGDNDIARPLAVLMPGTVMDAGAPAMPAVDGPRTPQRFAGADQAQITARRHLYFSETTKQFFITVVGQKPEPFRPNDPPEIVTHPGAVEIWTIENRTPQVHEFHIHQIHFKLLRQNGVLLPPARQQYLDVVQVPYYTGSGPYPSVTLLMDFRGYAAGDFVYHCHILNHEDQGMMAIIRVEPS